MKSFLLLITIAVLVEASFAYQNVYKSPVPTGENAGKCIFEGKEFEKGFHQISKCRTIHCLKDGSYIFRGCPKTSVEGCKRGEFFDETLEYPDCCRWHWICHDDKIGTYHISK